MSSTLDPAKLKVVELRAELSTRGLDTKGNKPVLVKRLKDALEKELQKELPDTSIADTSTEELNTSLTSQPDSEVEEKSEKQGAEAEPDKPENTEEPEAAKEPMETEAKPETEIVAAPTEESVPIEEKPAEPEGASAEDTNQVEPQDEAKAVENGEAVDEEKDSKCRKSRWGEAEEQQEKQDEPMQEDEKPPVEEELKGDKRKHNSPSPERSQRRRSKSPIKEDEPPIDNDKVQLSWYDSDLHLQVDKESFLSARPYHEGAFGYAWAGVRATHGITSGKVCFEVKITEELKWEDLIKPSERLAAQDSPPKKDQTPDNNETKPPKEANETEQEKSEIECKTEETTVEEPKTNDNEIKLEPKTENSEENASAENDSEKPVEDEKMQTEETPEPIPTHLFRVGWSLPNTCLQLGEHKFSYGYESSGRFVTDNQFSEYGSQFGVGDVITSYIEITTENVTLSYAVNGTAQGTAIVIPRTDFPDNENLALFPHILSRNYAFDLNLGAQEEAWFSHPEGLIDYVFLEKAEHKVQGPIRPETRNECEVIMMCGLPGAGKTHWVREFVQKNPEKRYTIIGNTQLLEKMTVDGTPLKNSYRGRWSVILDKLQKCLSRLVESAALRRRNYVIDQTNILPSAQRRKMRPFEGFKRRAVVVVVGDEEQAKRRALQEAEDGNDVTDNAVLEMKANMSIPRVGEWLEEVEYVELGEEEARAVVQKYNKQGRDAGFGNLAQNQRRDFRSNRYNRFPPNRRNDFRSGGGYRDHRNYPPSRFDRGPPRPWMPYRPGGWGRNDRRDSRGPPLPPRDWRNNNRPSDRSRNQISGGSYNRNRSSGGSSGSSGGGGGGGGSGGSRPPSNWQQGGSGNYAQHGSWQGSTGAAGWNQNQANWNQAWGGAQNQNQWKYGGGQSYGQNYGYPNYYYGQYAQNWSGTQQGGAATSAGAQYGQYTQQSWMQYAQQYAQAQTNPSTGTNQTTPQK